MILDLTVEGDGLASLHLQGLARRAGDLQPMFELMRPKLYEAEQKKFAKGWTKSTLRSYGWHTVTRGKNKGQNRIRDLRDHKHYTLVDSGRLRDSLTLAGNTASIFDVDSNSVRFGTSVYYARFLKKRGFTLIPVTKDLRADLSKTARDYLLGGTE